MSRNQTSLFVAVDDLVRVDHPYRYLDRLISFAEWAKPLQSLYSDRGRPELGAERAFRMLILQFMEDLSDP